MLPRALNILDGSKCPLRVRTANICRWLCRLLHEGGRKRPRARRCQVSLSGMAADDRACDFSQRLGAL